MRVPRPRNRGDSRDKATGSLQRFWAESLLGASLVGETKYAEAEPLLLEGYRGMQARKDLTAVPNCRHIHSAREWIVPMYEGWSKPEKATECKQH